MSGSFSSNLNEETYVHWRTGELGPNLDLKKKQFPPQKKKSLFWVYHKLIYRFLASKFIFIYLFLKGKWGSGLMMSSLVKLNYYLNKILIKIPTRFFFFYFHGMRVRCLNTWMCNYLRWIKIVGRKMIGGNCFYNKEFIWGDHD